MVCWPVNDRNQVKRETVDVLNACPRVMVFAEINARKAIFCLFERVPLCAHACTCSKVNVYVIK